MATPRSERVMANYRARKVMKDAGLWHKGWDVHHLDGNPYNNDISNLVCLPEHCHMVKYHPDICERRRRLAVPKAWETTSLPVLCVETGDTYVSLSEASRQTGIHVSNIARACRGEQKTAGKLHWLYIEKEAIK